MLHVKCPQPVSSHLRHPPSRPRFPANSRHVTIARFRTATVHRQTGRPHGRLAPLNVPHRLAGITPPGNRIGRLPAPSPARCAPILAYPAISAMLNAGNASGTNPSAARSRRPRCGGPPAPRNAPPGIRLGSQHQEKHRRPRFHPATRGKRADKDRCAYTPSSSDC